jgi:acyl-CoA synthetase (AMP-forming)/AMP-acid ligase II
MLIIQTHTTGDQSMLQPGLMMDRPLLLADVIEHAAQQFANMEVVSRETHGPLFRYTYADCAVRARQLANALASLGLQPGDAVGSIAWNNHRHLEAYCAVSGSGMVMHTCNPRLSPQQLIHIINHAEPDCVVRRHLRTLGQRHRSPLPSGARVGLPGRGGAHTNHRRRCQRAGL